MTSSDDAFEGYRRMVLEIDPINSGTKGKMMDVLTGLIAGGQCKSFKETKMKAMDLEIIVKAYRKRTNEDPDQSLLASVLSNIIGQKTKEKFSDLKMLHSYKDMKQNILETATEANMNVNRMDIGNVDAEKMAMHFNIWDTRWQGEPATRRITATVATGWREPGVTECCRARQRTGSLPNTVL